MDVFIKGAAGVLVALILFLILGKQGKDISVLLTITVCCMVAAIAASYLEPVINLIEKLQELGNLDIEILSVVLKATGIGLIAEICCTVCKDAGNDALGKTLQLLSSAAILWLSVPLFTNLISLFEKILTTI